MNSYCGTKGSGKKHQGMLQHMFVCVLHVFLSIVPAGCPTSDAKHCLTGNILPYSALWCSLQPPGYWMYGAPATQQTWCASRNIQKWGDGGCDGISAQLATFGGIMSATWWHISAGAAALELAWIRREHTSAAYILIYILRCPCWFVGGSVQSCSLARALTWCYRW